MSDLKTKPADATDVEIVFVGGWGRSGSTLLARMLAEVSDFVAVGEVRDVFLRGIIENRVSAVVVNDSVSVISGKLWVTRRMEAGTNCPYLVLKELRILTDKPWHVPALVRPGSAKEN